MGMDFKSKRNIAVTAGLTAVLALSPVAGPVITALAVDADTATTSARDAKGITIAQNLTVTVNFYAADGDDEPIYVYTYTYKNNWLGGEDLRPTLQNALDELVAEYPEYEGVTVWQINNTTDLSLLWDDASRLLGDKPSMNAANKVYNIHPYDPEAAETAEYTVVDADDPTRTYGTVSAVVGSNMFEALEKAQIVPEKDGYEFDYYTWKDYPNNKFGSATVALKSQDTIVAHFKQTVFSVTFDDGIDGTTNLVSKVNCGESVAEPTNEPEREGYTFGGWYTDKGCTEGNEYDFTKPVTGDMTLYAKWIQDEEPTDPEPGEGTEIPETPEEGTEQPGEGTEAPVAETHKVTFDDCLESTDNAVVVVEDGQVVTAPADPTCEGYTFQGWYSDTDLTQEWDFTTPVTEDMTLWAKWEKNAETPATSGESADADAETPATSGESADADAETPATSGESADADAETPATSGESADTDADDKNALPNTGDASAVVSGLGALGVAAAGLGAFLKRRR